MKLVVLISGNGSNLQALINAQQAGRLQGEIAAVISSRADAYGLQRASEAGIATLVFSGKDYPDREGYDAALGDAITALGADLIVMAGFMRILTPAFVRRFAGRMLNIHPSLLPKYQGINTHQRVLESGDTEHGTSVHFVTEELDGGPVILQAKVPVFAEDDAESLAERVQAQEHCIYPLVVNWFCRDRLTLRDEQAWLDNQPLPAAGYASEGDDITQDDETE